CSDKKNGLQQLLNELTTSFNSAEELLNNTSSSYNEKNIQFVQQENKLAASIRELEFKTQQLANTQQLLDSNNAELNSAIALSEELVQKLSASESSINADYHAKEEKEKSVATAEQVYYESRGKINELEEAARNFTKNKEQIEHLLSGIREKVTELKM